MANHRSDISKLVKRVHALSNALVGISRIDDLKELIKILRQPGWTTPAEFRFALGVVDSMIAQVQVLRSLKTALLSGSRAVTTDNR